MEKLENLTQYLDELLKPAQFRDSAYNGLQVDSQNAEVKRVAFAVDAGESVIAEACSQNADLLIVHHGLLWGAELPVTGAYSRKLKLCFDHGCSLYASHLPLDGSLETGNNVLLAKHLELSDVAPFCEYKGAYVGVQGLNAKKLTCEEIAERLMELRGAGKPLILPFGEDAISRIAIVTGSGSFAINLCYQEGIDLLVSGEPKHSVYHEARELRMNAIFAGHYATETVGVLGLMERMKSDFQIETFFIDQPTGI